jgi:hypothetical protein
LALEKAIAETVLFDDNLEFSRTVQRKNLQSPGCSRRNCRPDSLNKEELGSGCEQESLAESRRSSRLFSLD